MKCSLIGLILWLFLLINPAFGQDGESLFKINCRACHTIGKGIMVGPDLANISSRRPEKWLKQFIRSSQNMIKSGDPVAVELFKEFKEIIMPDPAISEAELEQILSYIAEVSPALVAEEDGKEVIAKAIAEPEGKPLSAVTTEDITYGKKLFAGHIRFENGGAACNSCHHVVYDGIMAGGALAKDLTNVFSRLNENGVKAVVSNSPFPLMQQAYKHKELSDEEVYALTAFLQHVDKEAIYQQPRNYTQRFIYTGIAGLFVLLLVFSTIWHRRRKDPVNKKVFNRQISSSRIKT